VVTTHDGGTTWSAQLITSNAFALSGFSAVSCPSTTQCLAVGDGRTNYGSYQLTSDDGGATWAGSLVNEGQPGAADGLSCVDADHRFAVGASHAAKYDSPVTGTSDAGTTWTPQAIQDGLATMRSVACTGPSSCWAAGGISTGAVIVHTVTGGHSWPEITGVSPASGPAAGGTTATITGTHLDIGVLSVSFGGTVTASFTVDSPTQITVTAPSMAEGIPPTVDVTVNTLVGPSPLTSADQFTYVPTP
jgi:photosystem II stability/assembly factor-like uncharacterized protein